MTLLPLSHLRAMMAIVRRDWSVFISYRFRLIEQAFSALAMIVMFRFTSKLVHVHLFQSSDQFFGFAVVGILTLQVLTSTLATPPATIRQELVAGTFERLVLSPFGAVMSVMSMMLFPLIYVISTCTLTLLLAVVFFGMPIDWSTAALAIPASVLAAISFMPFGILFAAATLAFKQATNLTSYVLVGVSILAGFYFPVSLLPSWLRWTSGIQPFTPSVDLIRHFLVGTPLQESAWLEILRVVAFTVVLLPVSVSALSSAVSFSRRRGTIVEF